MVNKWFRQTENERKHILYKPKFMLVSYHNNDRIGQPPNSEYLMQSMMQLRPKNGCLL